MKKIVYILILVALVRHGTAQQLGMYNHYFNKAFFYNPAFAGNGEYTEAMLLNRSQWTGFSNGPQLNIFTLDGALKEKKVGLGLSLISDKRGINRRAGGSLSYSYRMNINDETYIRLGLSAGVINQSIDYSKVIAESYTDVTLFSSSQQRTAFDGNAGLVFGWKGLELAASAPQLFGNKINYLDNSSATITSYRQARHYISSVKYKFTLSEEKEMFLAPQALVRIVPGAPLQYDGNLTFTWKNKGWLGATYKSNYAVAANAGVSLNRCLDIGYSYEFITGNIAKYAGMSQEIMVNYRFGHSKKNEEPHDPAAQNTQSSDYEHKLDSLHQELDQSKDKIAENERRIKELMAQMQQLKTQQQQMQQGNGGNNGNYGNNNGSTTAAYNNPANNTNNPSGNPSNTSQGNGTNNPASANGNPVSNRNTNSSGNPPNTTQNAGTNNPSGNSTTTSPANNTGSVTSAADPGTRVMEDNVWMITSPAGDYKTSSGSTPSKGFYVVVGTFFYQDFAVNETKRFKNKGYGSANWMYSNSKQFNYVFIKKTGTKQEALSAAKELQKSGVSDAWIKVLE